MHPDLSEAKLSSLPLAIRRHAKTVLSPSTSPESASCSLRRLVVQCIQARDKGYTARSLLPVVYAVLGDPNNLPNPETTPEPLYRTRVCCVGHAFALFTCCTQIYTSPALIELTPRIWAWIQFMDIHEYVPVDSGMFFWECVPLTCLLYFLHDHEGRQWLHTDAEVVHFIGKTWNRLVTVCENDQAAMDNDHCREVLQSITSFLSAHDSPEYSNAFVDGAGGKYEFARLLIRTINLFLRIMKLTDQKESDFSLLLSLDSTLSFICYDRFVSRAALDRAGIVQTLIHAISYLARPNAPVTTPFQSSIALCADILSASLSKANSVSWGKAVNAGLLSAVFQCGGKYGTDPYTGKSLSRILADLTTSTFSYCFLPVFMSELPSVTMMLPSTGFMRCRFGKDWRGIVSLAQERTELRKVFDSNLLGIRSCDNFECGVINVPKASLRRCGTCQHTFYCSPECQKISWRKFNHRYMCKCIQKDSNIIPDARTTRFRFTLILNTYRKHKLPILLQKLEYIHRTGTTDYCVVLEYVAGYCTPKIAPIEEWEESLASHEYGQRTATGTREMHVVCLAPGGAEFPLLLRSNKPEVLERLVGIAGRLPKDADVGKLKDDLPEIWREVEELAGIDVVEAYS
ncbi:hypothetical protein R3P38DRAFT_2609802 [Favolaschia claudopus]|uniref:MYND-type domain-containing protein n=1 Tax=Favolaschia claudopus TaxID=2862362 RepID=A0AAW0CWJ2_9AGAR